MRAHDDYMLCCRAWLHARSDHHPPNPTLPLPALVQEVWRGKVEQISWEPRAWVFRGFLSEEECHHLMSKANRTMTPSTVVDSSTGGSMSSRVRTSSGTWFPRGADEVISDVEDRIALVSMIPKQNGEGIQVLRYRDGQEYKPHTDYFHDKFNTDTSHGGQRLATMLMYLTTPGAGGETVFPMGLPKSTGPGFSDCGRTGLSVRPRAGDAILFYSLKPDGSEDIASTHGSCPTLEGEKWSATKWMHRGHFYMPNEDGSKCSDAKADCSRWARAGECDRNPNYMHAYCAKSCNICGRISSVLRKRSRREGAEE